MQFSILSLMLAAASFTSAAPIAKREASNKRILAWDYTNTQNPSVAPRISNADIGSSQVQGVLNWNTWVPEELSDKSKFQPTVRTTAQASGDDWTWLVNQARAYPGTIVHTFNEPERNGLDAGAAASIWNNQLAQLRRDTGAKLVTPAIANTPEGKAWLDSFMSQITANPPDFLGLHFYDTSADNAMNYFAARHAEHNYPVIVSEIACINPDAGAVEATTRQWANAMDNSDFIAQYAFFGAMTVLPQDGGFFPRSSLLMNEDGSFKQILNDLVHAEPL